MIQTIPVECYGASHIGYVRQENQDVWMAMPSEGVFFLADGMGGRKGGLMAASLATDVLAEQLSSINISHLSSISEITDCVKNAFMTANLTILNQAHKQAELEGMGTTLLLLWILSDVAIIAHVGDSRLYLLRKDRLQQLTQDHGFYAPNKEKTGSRWVLSRAVGVTSHLEVSIQVLAHQPGDLFMLCTDGLSSSMSGEQMKACLIQNKTLDLQASALISGALNRGGRDNITFILVKR